MNQPIQYLSSWGGAGQKNRTLLESCVASFPAIIFKYDLLAKEVTCVNNKLFDHLGFTNQEFENLHYGLTGIVYEDDLEILNDATRSFDVLSEERAVTFSARFKHKAGGCRNLKCVCTRINPVSVLIIAQDITEEVKKDDEAAACLQRFDEAEKLLRFGTWSWRPGSDEVEWSDGMYQLLGYASKDIPQLSHDFYLKQILPEHLDRFQQAIDAAVGTRSSFEVEYGVKTKGGADMYVFTKGKVLLNKEGNVKKLVGITRDVTGKKNFEKERDRNIRELNRSNKELEEFAYVASHDLHEPLRKILTFSERLKGKLKTSMELDESKTYLERIWASADSMRRLIDNLLEFSKISRSSRLFKDCNLNDILKDVLLDQELRIEETSTIIKIKDLPVVRGVPSELRQLFNNLISNALKFRKTEVQPVIDISGKKLSHNEKSHLLLSFNESYYQIDVKDNGIGFEAEYAEKIFEIFQRLHGKSEYSGSGIGLAICKKIVENHDGIIFATGEPGVGSIFSVILPEKQYN